jgi:glycosyltransferase involved in cell wall biosynthesis
VRCSFIIPAFNAERFLPRTVASIREQTVVDWELTIVDDGSSDSTPRICDEAALADPRVRVIHQSNTGLAAARNVGFSASSANTEFLLFIDADDLLLPNAVATLLAVAEALPNAPAVYGDCTYIADDGRELGDLFPERRVIRDAHAASNASDVAGVRVSPPYTFAVGNCISSTGQVLIRRWALEQAGVFDEALSPVADWDLWLRMSEKAGHLAFVDKQVMAYRVHGTSMSQHRPKMRRAEALMKLKHLKSSAEMRTLLIQGIRKLDRDNRLLLMNDFRQCLAAASYGKLPSTVSRLAYLAARDLIPVTWPLFINAHLRGG